MAMLSRRTGQFQGCSAPICFDPGCRGCGDGLGFHVGACGRGRTLVEILGLFPRRVVATRERVFDAVTEEQLDPRQIHRECRRFGYRVLLREHYGWRDLLWVWDASQSRITVHAPDLRIEPAPGVEVVRATEAT